MRAPRVLAAILWVWLGASAARADDEELLRRIEVLEERVRELEAEAEERDSPGPQATLRTGEPSDQDWTRRVRLSGSANTGYYWGQEDSVFSDRRFQIWDARLFVDAELGRELHLGDAPLARNAGLTFEWNLVRLGQLDNDVGELFAEVQGLLGSDWANLRAGRFQIPVGQAYESYGRGYPAKPFISHPVGAPWWWDEGLALYGGDPEGRFGYVASVTDGETPFGADFDDDKQVTLKLVAEPLPWLEVTLSGLRSGGLGSQFVPALGALWLGESFAQAFGSGTDVPNTIDGAEVADGPNRLHDSYLGSVDLISRLPDWGQLWLAYGAYHIDSTGADVYDRTLHYWIAEVLVEAGRLSPLLDPFYLGFRASGLGTYDRDRGYLLDWRYGETLGYNMRSVDAFSSVLGWRLSRWLTLRTEYTHQRFELVRGVDPALRKASDDADFAGIEVGASF